MNEYFRFHRYYIDETEKIKDPNIKAILKLLKKENNWFEH